MKKKLWNICRRVLSILLNLAVVWMEPIAARLSWEAVGTQMFTFYTENSNFFTAGVCLLMALAQLKALLTGREIPRWIKRLKYVATCCLTMTFLTVVLVLAPYYKDEGGVRVPDDVFVSVVETKDQNKVYRQGGKKGLFEAFGFGLIWLDQALSK